jgi:hypothetical protein
MARELEAFGRRKGDVFDLRHFTRKLRELFPYDNEYSAALWRLAVVRDDIDRELDGIAIPADADEERVWEHCYFLRRLTVSILEAKSLIDQQVSKMLKYQARRNSGRARMHEAVKALMERLSDAEALLRPMRDAFGGHVQPNAANPDPNTTESYDVRGLRTYAESDVTVTFNTRSTLGTNYRNLTKVAYLHAWPDVVDAATLLARTDEFQAGLRVVRGLLSTIDAVLYAFWIDRDVIEPIAGDAPAGDTPPATAD